MKELNRTEQISVSGAVTEGMKIGGNIALGGLQLSTQVFPIVGTFTVGAAFVVIGGVVGAGYDIKHLLS